MEETFADAESMFWRKIPRSFKKFQQLVIDLYFILFFHEKNFISMPEILSGTVQNVVKVNQVILETLVIKAKRETRH